MQFDHLPLDQETKIPINFFFIFLSAYVRVEVPGIINMLHSGGRSKTLRLCVCTKTDLIRFPHLHTIKLCSEPLRRDEDKVEDL